MSPHFDPHELEPPVPPTPQVGRFLQARRADREALTVGLVLLVVGLVGLALLFTGWLS